jgi:voltage-gated potassium channel
VKPDEQRPDRRLQARVFEVVFESDTPAGRLFDVSLLFLIIGSVLAVILESVDGYRRTWGHELRVAEWTFTALFALEYVVRVACVRRPLRYVTSFFGIVDLLAVIPTPLSLLVPGAQALLVVRVVRLLRVFRILKLVSFSGEADVLLRALRASRAKVTVFVGGVLSVVVIAGALLYLVEGPASGFDNIPRGIYWAIVTLTTVGYGDVTPQSPLGQTIASVLMIMGYGIIAVPTGIVSVEIANASRGPVSVQACPGCGKQGHDSDAVHCKHCGTAL